MKKIGIKRIILFFTIILITGIVVLFMLPVNYPVEPNYIQSNFEEIDPYQSITKEEMISDIEFFVDRLLDIHPDPYRFVTEEEFINKVNEVTNKIETASHEDILVLDFFRYVKEINAILRDEHITFRLPNFNHEKIFPYRVRIYEGTPYILLPEDDGKQQFHELIAVNGLHVQDIISTLLKYQNSALEHRQRRGVEQDFFYLSYYFDWDDNYKIVYLDEDEKEREKAFNGIASGNGRRDEFVPFSKKYLQVKGYQVPLLQLNSFFGFNINEYRDFIDDFFVQNHEQDYLIIDLRQNGGGNAELGHYVLNYLTDESYTTYHQFQYKISNTLLNKFRYDVESEYYQMGIPNLFWSLPLYRFDPEHGSLLKNIFSAEVGSLVTEGPFKVTPPQSNYKFKGDVYLLIGNYTGSAAIDMAAAFKYNNFGTVVGQETSHPHSYFGNTGQSAYEMPNSGIIFAIPITFSLSAKGYDDQRGVMPDIEIKYSLEDYLDSYVDLEIEYLKQLIWEQM